MKKKTKEMTFKKARLIIVMVSSLVVLSFLLGTFVGASFRTTEELKRIKLFNEKEIKETKPLVDEDNYEPLENSKYTIKEVLYDTSSYSNDSVEKVELTTDGILLVSINYEDTNINRQEIAKNVNKTFLVNVGMSELCEGNRRLIYFTDDSYEYLHIDELVCGHNIDTHVIEGIKDIVDIEEKKESNAQYEEPDNYTVYAVDKNNRKYDITGKLE